MTFHCDNMYAELMWARPLWYRVTHFYSIHTSFLNNVFTSLSLSLTPSHTHTHSHTQTRNACHPAAPTSAHHICFACREGVTAFVFALHGMSWHARAHCEHPLPPAFASADQKWTHLRRGGFGLGFYFCSTDNDTSLRRVWVGNPKSWTIWS